MLVKSMYQLCLSAPSVNESATTKPWSSRRAARALARWPRFAWSLTMGKTVVATTASTAMVVVSLMKLGRCGEWEQNLNMPALYPSMLNSKAISRWLSRVR